MRGPIRLSDKSLRQAPKQFVSKIVDDLNLGKWVAQEAAREKLVMAGYRGQAPYVTFLFFRMVMLIGAIAYFFCYRTRSNPPLSGSASASAPS